MKPFLYQPVKPFKLNQGFGEDKTCVDSTGTKFITKDTFVTCPVGYTSVYQKAGMKGHNGLDLHAQRWQPIYCSLEGEVCEVSTEKERGLGVVVFSKTEDGYIKHLYWHLIALNVHVKDKVKAGHLLGYADSTGQSSGDHLHWEIKPCDKNKKNLKPNNGYNGAIDPLPLTMNVFALDADKFIKAKEMMAKILDMFSDFIRYGKN